MELSTLIKRADLAANGKSRTLDVASPRYQKFKDLANMLQDDWMSEPGVDWSSRYERVSLGTITSDRVAMDDSIYEVSKRQGDYVIVRYGTAPGAYSRWNLVDSDTLRIDYSRNVVSVIGGELIFPRTFVSGDLEYGGEVIVPAYVKLDELEDPTDETQVDDPNWLVYMMAAEFVRNTVTKVQNYQTLVQKANNLMVKMKEKNNAQMESIAMYPSTLGDPASGYWGAYSNSAGQPLGD